MKFSRLIPLTLINSFMLFILSTVLVGCNKDIVTKSGMLTHYKKLPSRSIASVNNKMTFIKYQDPKQILIYCSKHSKHMRSCYNSHLKKIFHNYQMKYSHESLTEFQKIEDQYKFENIEKELTQINESIKKELTPLISDMVVVRTKFCKQNSTKYLKKCLTQYIPKDTFKVLNSFQQTNKVMNAHEYLYYKKLIQSEFKSQMSVSYNHLK